MEKEWLMESPSDFVWKQMAWISLFGSTVWIMWWSHDEVGTMMMWVFGLVALYFCLLSVWRLWRTVVYRRKNPIYFRVVGQILHYSLPEMGQGQIDVRQLDLLRYRIQGDLRIPIRGDSGCLKIDLAHFQKPFIHQSHQEWVSQFLGDLEKAQWHNQQPFDSFLNKEISS
ncbi:hypothetical protein [Alysiella filiformis]|uniref:Uncharacterized protein n=1 Tax=Alysiella filiformis DSM 16848 TaxID=1120981 RepID=A0A286E481_9NEIS|nr:hypothetical protein [Alysiella filiformis]QMT31000.1 hypothetical protein H3L97_09765 [Alysiella filiformis]UBQ56012.1 hypothetical protein JF568_10705 [Alysiella filiformis DSM 16848]SOD65717.1 hypothetical protein SAMN02746062_00397 [Alysiella filiformis DSM 16848]